MAITTYEDFANNYLVKNGQLGDANNLNKATDQLKIEIDEINANSVDIAALNLKANINNPTFTGTVTGISKAMVGLGNADNTADSNKNVLSATKLATSRTINGVSFDGTTNIVITDNTKLGVTAKAADSDKLDGMEPTASGTPNTIVQRDSFGGTVLAKLSLGQGASIVENATNYQILFTDMTQLNLGQGFSQVNIKGATAWHNGNATINKNQNGSMSLPNGLIVKWGLVDSSSFQDTIIFPTAFPNMCVYASATLLGTSAGYASLNASPTQMQIIFNKSQGFNLLWYAIGF